MVSGFVAAATHAQMEPQDPYESAFTWGHSVFGLAIALTVQGELPQGHPAAVPVNHVIDQLLGWMWNGVTFGTKRGR